MNPDQIAQIIQSKCIKPFGAKAVIPWNLDSIAQAIHDGAALYRVDPLLALAQGILECHFACNPAAKRSRLTKNIFNVGNVDNGANRFFSSYEAGIDAYFRLMAREYCWRAEGDRVTLQMMLAHDFTRPRGGRYASAPDYTRQIEIIANSLQPKSSKRGTK